MARILPADGFFHLIARGNNDTRVCRNRRDFLELKRRLFAYCTAVAIEVYKYAIMHTHYHLLAWVPDTALLGKSMQALQLSYHHYYRRQYHYKGHLWQSRYRSILIENESHLHQCGRYHELNAVFAGLVAKPDAYPWTSYHYYAFGRPDFLITPSALFATPDEAARRAYREFVHAGIDVDYQRQKRMFEKSPIS